MKTRQWTWVMGENGLKFETRTRLVWLDYLGFFPTPNSVFLFLSQICICIYAIDSDFSYLRE